MADPYVREIGRVKIPGAQPVIVGIDHGAVEIMPSDYRNEQRLTVMQADELAALLITACWQASAHPCPAGCGSPVHQSEPAVPQACPADCGEITHDWACKETAL